MSDILVTVFNDGDVALSTDKIGYNGENKARNIVITLESPIEDGTAVLEIEQHSKEYFLSLTQEGNKYTLPIYESLLAYPEISMQFRLIKDENVIIKSKIFTFEIDDSINAIQKQIPEEYVDWFTETTNKVQDLENKINEVEGQIPDVSEFITKDVDDLTNYTKTEDLERDYAKKTDVSKVYRYKGSVEKYSDLKDKEADAQVGDTYDVKETGKNYAWTDDGEWDDLGGTIDLSNYVEKEVTGEKGKSLISNDPTGGILKFTTDDGRESAVAVNDGTEGIYAELYSKESATNQGARVIVGKDKAYYTVSDSVKVTNEDEIVTAKDVKTYYLDLSVKSNLSTKENIETCKKILETYKSGNYKIAIYSKNNANRIMPCVNYRVVSNTIEFTFIYDGPSKGYISLDDPAQNEVMLTFQDFTYNGDTESLSQFGGNIPLRGYLNNSDMVHKRYVDTHDLYKTLSKDNQNIWELEDNAYLTSKALNVNISTDSSIPLEKNTIVSIYKQDDKVHYYISTLDGKIYFGIVGTDGTSEEDGETTIDLNELITNGGAEPIIIDYDAGDSDANNLDKIKKIVEENLDETGNIIKPFNLILHSNVQYTTESTHAPTNFICVGVSGHSTTKFATLFHFINIDQYKEQAIDNSRLPNSSRMGAITIKYTPSGVTGAEPKINFSDKRDKYVAIGEKDIPRIITKTDNSVWTPTEDYDAVHKKYVDDLISNISKIETIPDDKQQITPWTLEDGLYYVQGTHQVNYSTSGIDYIENNFILVGSRTGTDDHIVKQIHMICRGTLRFFYIDTTTKEIVDNMNYIANFKQYLAKNNTTAYEVTADYNPAHKKYVDDAIANISGGGNEIMHITETDLTNEVKLQEIYDKYLELGHEPLVYMRGTASANQITLLGAVVPSEQSVDFYFTPIASGSTTTMNRHEAVFSMALYTNVTCELADGKISNPNKSDIRLTPLTAYSSTLSSWSDRLALSVKNTAEYTPTEDYNPATKKYVDDAVANSVTGALEGEY